MDYNKRIDNLIIKYNKVNYIYNFQSKTNKSFDDNNNINQRLEKISEMAYFQDWQKLHIIQKKIKIEEFIDNLMIKNKESNLKDIKIELINKLNNKNLHKKDIQYDKLNGKILDILCLNKQDSLFILD